MSFCNWRSGTSSWAAPPLFPEGRGWDVGGPAVSWKLDRVQRRRKNLQNRQPQLGSCSDGEEGLGLNVAGPGQGVCLRPRPLLSSWAAGARSGRNGFSRFPQKNSDRVAPPGLAYFSSQPRGPRNVPGAHLQGALGFLGCGYSLASAFQLVSSGARASWPPPGIPSQREERVPEISG